MDSYPPPQAQTHETDGQLPQMRAVLCADLVDSTALVERLGDIPASELIRRHDRLARDLLQRHRGQEIDKTDGFLILFNRAIDALAFGLEYQRALRQLGIEVGQPLRARVGIHLGEVLLWENALQDVAQGAKPVEVEGLAKPVAARLMGLAAPGQILLSGVAFNLAQRAAGELGEIGSNLRWLTHGRYQFKGVAQAQLVHEVGEPGIATLRAPSSTAKVRREAPLWRRPGTIVLEVLAAALVLAGALYLILGSAPVIAFAERDWLVVADLVDELEDDRFESALETALRIGLEQSRRVNVLSELATRDGARRMGLAPDAELDRSKASELAVREGARAVVVPFVAEVGGRLRVGVDLVEPVSRRVVLTRHAEGEGIDSALASLQQVTDALRQTLGESLADIQASSDALEKVTTPSLDALRAYSLGQQSLGGGDLGKALALFEQALSLDPGFALAHGGVARVRHAQGDFVAAVESMRRALADPERLTDRERLYAQAQFASFTWEPEYIERWRALTSLYPDFHIAQHNLVILLWNVGRYAEMVEAAARAASPQSVTRPVSVYLRGVGLLALGRLEPAMQAFEESEDLGFKGFSVEHAGVFAAQRRYDEAQAVLRRMPAAAPYVELTRRVAELGFTVDRGDWTAAARLAADMVSEAQRATGYQWALRANALAGERDPAQAGRRLAQVRDALTGLADEIASRGAPLHPAREGIALAYFAYLAARDGDEALAQQGLDVIQRWPVIARQRPVANAVAIAQARLDLLEGAPDAALERLAPFLGQGELLLTRVLEAEARMARGDLRGALVVFEAIAASRGQAYAEWGADHLLLVENLVQVNRALLRAAEIALLAGDRDASRRHLAAFRTAWPTLEGAPDLGARSEALAAELARP